MKFTVKMAAAAALIFGIAGANQAHAQNTNYWVQNNTKNAVWVTVYGTGFETDKREFFCLTPGQSKVNYVNILTYTNLYIRGEVKQSTNNCNTSSNIHDVGPTILTLTSDGKAQMIFGSNSVGGDVWSNNSTSH